MYAYQDLVKARHDDLTRAAAQSRHAAQIRRQRGPRRHRVIAAPLQRLTAALRPRSVSA
jgi:hypothetical protein